MGRYLSRNKPHGLCSPTPRSRWGQDLGVIFTVTGHLYIYPRAQPLKGAGRMMGCRNLDPDIHTYPTHHKQHICKSSLFICLLISHYYCMTTWFVDSRSSRIFQKLDLEIFLKFICYSNLHCSNLLWADFSLILRLIPFSSSHVLFYVPLMFPFAHAYIRKPEIISDCLT